MSYLLTIPYTDLNPLPPNKGNLYSPRLLTLIEFNNVRSKFFFHSVIDSGADNCVFPAAFGEALGLDITKGTPTQMSGFGGGGHCYYHQVKVYVQLAGQIWHFNCFAGFSERMNDLGVGLLGRHGFFELFEEVIFDQNNKVFKLKVPGERPPTAGLPPQSTPSP